MEETNPPSLGPNRLSAGLSLRREARFARTAMRPGNDAEVQLNYSGTSPYGHLYNTDTSLLRTVHLVPERPKSM